jgi:hypothetical protein
LLESQFLRVGEEVGGGSGGCNGEDFCLCAVQADAKGDAKGFDIFKEVGEVEVVKEGAGVIDIGRGRGEGSVAIIAGLFGC